MSIIADAYFTIGQAHIISGKPCQDYAIAEHTDPDGAIAVVSDGCSGGRNTDVGSRVIALATAGVLKTHWSGHHDAPTLDDANIIATASDKVMLDIQSALGCHLEDMLATRLYAYLGAIGGIAHVQGDGVIAWREANDTIIARRYEWRDPSNPQRQTPPFYPIYSDDTYQGFTDYYGGDSAALAFHCDEVRFTGDGIISHSTVVSTIAEGIRGGIVLLPPSTRTVAVFTDGITQIQEADRKDVLWSNAVKEMLTFKSTTGEFAKRRMMHYVKQSRRQGGSGPLDDLSYAVLTRAEE